RVEHGPVGQFHRMQAPTRKRVIEHKITVSSRAIHHYEIQLARNLRRSNLDACHPEAISSPKDLGPEVTAGSSAAQDASEYLSMTKRARLCARSRRVFIDRRGAAMRIR